MSKRLAGAALATLVTLGGVSCTSKPPLSPIEQQERRQAYWRSRFQPVSYRVSEGGAGADEWIHIRGDGVVEMSGRLFGTALAQLDDREIARLAESFRDWDKLNREYAAAGEDHPREELTYNGKTVRVRGNPADLPDAYARARAAVIDSSRKLEGQR